jgi:hypothetical protein
VSAVGIANVYVALGQTENAFEWLERAYEQREYILTTLNVSPAFDPIRGDPRFEDLLRRVGL